MAELDRRVKKRLGALLGNQSKNYDSPKRKHFKGDERDDLEEIVKIGAEKFGKIFDHKDDVARLFKPTVNRLSIRTNSKTMANLEGLEADSDDDVDPCEEIFRKYMSDPAAREETRRMLASEARERMHTIKNSQLRSQTRVTSDRPTEDAVVSISECKSTNIRHGDSSETQDSSPVAPLSPAVDTQAEAILLAAEIKEAASPEFVAEVCSELDPLALESRVVVSEYLCHATDSPLAPEKGQLLDVVRDDRCYVETGRENTYLDTVALKCEEEVARQRGSASWLQPENGWNPAGQSQYGNVVGRNQTNAGQNNLNQTAHGTLRNYGATCSNHGEEKWGTIQSTGLPNQDRTPCHGEGAQRRLPIGFQQNPEQQAQNQRCQQGDALGIQQDPDQQPQNQPWQQGGPGFDYNPENQLCQQGGALGIQQDPDQEPQNQPWQQGGPGFDYNPENQLCQQGGARGSQQNPDQQPQNQPWQQGGPGFDYNPENQLCQQGGALGIQQNPDQQPQNQPWQQGGPGFDYNPENQLCQRGNGPSFYQNPGPQSQNQPCQQGNAVGFHQNPAQQAQNQPQQQYHNPDQQSQNQPQQHQLVQNRSDQHTISQNRQLQQAYIRPFPANTSDLSLVQCAQGVPQNFVPSHQSRVASELQCGQPRLAQLSVHPERSHAQSASMSRDADTNYSVQMPLWAHGLDSSQLAAASSPFDQPQIVSAGPGAGKTHYLVARTLRYKMEHPRLGVACVTFSRDVAGEVDGRIRAALKQLNLPAENLFCGTIHKLALRIVRTFSEELGFGEQIKMANSKELESALKCALSQCNRGGAGAFQNWADMAEDVSDDELPDVDVRKILNRLRRMQKFPQFAAKQDENVRNIYGAFKEVMRQKRLIDVNDLVPLATRAFQHDIARDWATKFLSYVLVDEFQDTDCAQIELFRRITAQSITAVGDEDQMIYGWRMSKEGFDTTNPFNIFEQLFFNCQLHCLERNYRSPPEICAASGQLMQKALCRRSDKISISMLPSSPASIQCVVKQNTDKEIDWIVREMQAAQAPWSNFAILTRLNKIKEAIERKLRECNIPTRGPKLKQWEPTCRSFLGYLKLAVNAKDDAAFLDVYNKPKRGLGTKFIDQLDKMPGGSYFEKIQNFVNNTRSKMATHALSLLNIINNLQTGLAVDALQHIATLVGMEIPSMLLSLAGIMDVPQFLAETKEPRSICVSVSTIHGAKGLEWNTVFVARVNEGVLPMLGEDGRDEDEERRLLYVAMTRARRKLYLTCALHDDRNQPMEPSHFLCEAGVV